MFAFACTVNAQTSSIKLLFVGDIMGHDEQIKSAQIDEHHYNYRPCFTYVNSIIQEADLAVANLELTLPGSPPFHGYPNFKSPNELASALKDTGFDIIATANNHSNDAGKKGLENTVNTLQEKGFYQTGTFKNAEDRDLFYPLIVYKNDFKLAFLNYTFSTNQIRTKYPNIVNDIDLKIIEEDMKIARDMKPDAIIVMMHWGKEYVVNEHPRQVKLVEKIGQMGADIIIGSHPHVVQPIKEEIILQNDGSKKKVLVTYSLGNFISSQIRQNTDGGIIFEVELTKDHNTGITEVQKHHFIPVWRYIHKDIHSKKTFYTIPISAFENTPKNVLSLNKKALESMNVYAKNLRNHLNKSDCTERKIKFEELNYFVPKTPN